MIYKQGYFYLDAETRRVFDTHGRELHITGNAYRVLEYLCKKGSTTLTELGSFLDWAKDYDHNHIRQYRYKINSILGANVVEYKDGVYSLASKAEIIERIPDFERITSPLQPVSVKLNTRQGMEPQTHIPIYSWPTGLAIVMVLIAMLPMPYGYYTVLRFVVALVCIYYAYYCFKVMKRTSFIFWALIAAAILFNPITPIYLYSRTLWTVLDLLLVILLVVTLRVAKQSVNNKHRAYE